MLFPCKISGKVVGIIYDDMMIIQVTKWRFNGLGTSARALPIPLPLYVMRWIGHDFTIESGSKPYEVQLGDHVEFVTSRQEQNEYIEKVQVRMVFDA